MLVFRMWTTEKRGIIYCTTKTWHGWFLLGFIPLYIKHVETKRT